MHWLIYLLIAGVALAVALFVILSKTTPVVSHDVEPVDDHEWQEWPQAAWPDSDLRTPRSAALSVVTVKFDRDMSKLKVGDVAVATVYLNGVPAPVATQCQWAMNATGIVNIAQSTTTPGLNRIIALKAGTVQLIAILAQGVYSWPPATAIVVAAPVPVPPPMPPVLSPVPAALWAGLFTAFRVHMTDFYYDWLSAMYAIVAKRYDVFMSMKHVSEIKALNANARNIVYVLQYTTLIDPPALLSDETPFHSEPPESLPRLNNGSGLIRHYLRAQSDHHAKLAREATPERLVAAVDASSAATKYLVDFETWRKARGISDAAAEAAFLHDATGKRIMPYLWNSPRNAFDPRDQVARDYTLDRLTRIANLPSVDGLFADELGKGVMEPVWKLASATNTAMLQAIEDAEVSLLALVRNALAKTGKQLVVNTASYTFAFDAACADAAGGTHMEQTNNPLQGDLTAGTWAFIDARLAKGSVVNLVPPLQFGEYESQVGKTGTQHMDTPRGKLLELASALMVTVNPASLLWLSLENGDWAKYTPVTNWLKQIDAIAKIGLPLEKRIQLSLGAGAGGTLRRAFERRFEHGLVVFNAIYYDIWNRSSQDYGGDVVTVVLPTDRAYFLVQSDGTVATQRSISVTLRTPEAAIFVTAQ